MMTPERVRDGEKARMEQLLHILNETHCDYVTTATFWIVILVSHRTTEAISLK